MYMVEFVLMKDSDCISLWTLKPQKEWCNRIKIYYREQVEKAMATHSSVLAWRIPGTAEPGGVTQSQRWLKQLSSSSRSIESRREQKRHCRNWRTEGLAWPLIQDSIFKSRDITLPTKVHLVKAMVFPVVVYGCVLRKLSAEELMLLNCGVGEDTWESLGLQGEPTSPF